MHFEVKRGVGIIMVVLGILACGHSAMLTIQMAKPAGELYFPLRNICSNANSLSSHVKWQFSAYPQRMLLLVVEDFSISCFKAMLQINSIAPLYCNTNNLTDSFLRVDAPLSVDLRTRDCSSKLNITYYYTKIIISTEPEGVVAVGETISLRIILLLPLREMSVLDCEVTFQNSSSLMLMNNETRLLVSHNLPQSHKYSAKCNTRKSPSEDLKHLFVVVAEDDFSDRDLQTKCLRCSGTFGISFKATFQHQYVYPASYSLELQDFTFHEQSRPFENASYAARSPVNVEFLLEAKTQLVLGAGIHSCRLFIFNNISIQTFHSSISLNKPLTGLNIRSAVHIGLHPNNFDVYVRIPNGAPAKISILLKTSDNKTVTSVQAACDNMVSCIELLVKMPSPKATGLYHLYGNAGNTISSSNAAWGPIACLPQVYDIYTTIRDPYAGRKNNVAIFVRADVGNFSLMVQVESIRHVIPLKISAESNDHRLRLPFEGSTHSLVMKSIVFDRSGFHHLSVSISNGKQWFNNTMEIHVRAKETCFQGLTLRGGSATTTNEPLNVGEYLILSADASVACLDQNDFDITWGVYKVASVLSAPKSDDEVKITANLNQAEIVIYGDELQQGLYIAVVTISEESLATETVILKDGEFAFFRIVEKSFSCLIAGGSKREIGLKVSNASLEAVTSIRNANVRFTWICATSQRDLPTDPSDGMFVRKGSCFPWQPSQLSEKTSSTYLSFSSLVKSNTYFIRLFADASGYKRCHADQEIVPVNRISPNLRLRCSLNCGKGTLGGEPLILQLECDTCVRRTWELNVNGVTQLVQCTDQEWCGFESVTFAGYPVGSKLKIIATGSSSDGAIASVSRDVLFLPPPKGHCFITPKQGYAFTTNYTITCAFVEEENVTLQYKFFVRRNGNRQTLIHYSYSNILTDLRLAPDIGAYTVVIAIHVCKQTGTCAVRTLSATVIDTNDDVALAEIIEANVQVQNYQTLMALLASDSSKRFVTKPLLSNTLKALKDIQLYSTESVKLVADLIDHLSRQTLAPNDESEIRKIASNIKNYVTSLSSLGGIRDNEVKAILTSYLSIISHLMQNNVSKISDATEVASIPRYFMKHFLPHQTESFRSDSVEAAFLRSMQLSKNGNGKLNVEMLNVSLRNVAPVKHLQSHAVTNVQVVIYDWPKMWFGSVSGRVDQVTSVAVTTGSENTPRFGRSAYDFNVNFNFKADAVLTEFPLRVTTESNESLSRRIAVGRASLERKNSSEILDGAYLQLIFYSRSITASSIFLKWTDEKNVSINHQAPWTAAKPVIWLIPINETFTTTHTLEVEVNLGSKFFIEGQKLKPLFAAQVLNCFRWSYLMNDWSSKNCQPVAAKSNHSRQAHCECMPRTSPRSRRTVHGTTGFDVQNYNLFASRRIHFTSIVDKSELVWDPWKEIFKNPLIVVFHSLLFAFYFLLWLWAWKKDREDRKQPYYIEVVDNSPFAKYRYLVIVFTGHCYNAGTTAAVSLVLKGVKHQSDAHTLQKTGGNLLRRATVQPFLITTPDTLGDITEIELRRTSRGKDSGWYLDRVLVRNLETNELWFFPCCSWFSTKNKQSFRGAKGSQLQQLTNLFGIKYKNYLADKHIWISLFSMNPLRHRTLTRRERFASSLNLFSITMISNFILYGMMTQLPDFELEAGRFMFSTNEVGVGLLGAFVSMFPTEVLTSLFRLYPKNDRSLNKGKGRRGTFTAEELQIFQEGRSDTSRIRQRQVSRLSKLAGHENPSHMNDSHDRKFERKQEAPTLGRKAADHRHKDKAVLENVSFAVDGEQIHERSDKRDKHRERKMHRQESEQLHKDSSNSEKNISNSAEEKKVDPNQQRGRRKEKHKRDDKRGSSKSNVREGHVSAMTDINPAREVLKIHGTKTFQNEKKQAADFERETRNNYNRDESEENRLEGIYREQQGTSGEAEKGTDAVPRVHQHEKKTLQSKMKSVPGTTYPPVFKKEPIAGRSTRIMDKDILDEDKMGVSTDQVKAQKIVDSRPSEYSSQTKMHFENQTRIQRINNEADDSRHKEKRKRSKIPIEKQRSANRNKTVNNIGKKLEREKESDEIFEKVDKPPTHFKREVRNLENYDRLELRSQKVNTNTHNEHLLINASENDGEIGFDLRKSELQSRPHYNEITSIDSEDSDRESSDGISDKEFDLSQTSGTNSEAEVMTSESQLESCEKSAESFYDGSEKHQKGSACTQVHEREEELRTSYENYPPKAKSKTVIKKGHAKRATRFDDDGVEIKIEQGGARESDFEDANVGAERQKIPSEQRGRKRDTKRKKRIKDDRDLSFDPKSPSKLSAEANEKIHEMKKMPRPKLEAETLSPRQYFKDQMVLNDGKVKEVVNETMATMKAKQSELSTAYEKGKDADKEIVDTDEKLERRHRKKHKSKLRGKHRKGPGEPAHDDTVHEMSDHEPSTSGQGGNVSTKRKGDARFSKKRFRTSNREKQTQPYPSGAAEWSSKSTSSSSDNSSGSNSFSGFESTSTSSTSTCSDSSSDSSLVDTRAEEKTQVPASRCGPPPSPTAVTYTRQVGISEIHPFITALLPTNLILYFTWFSTFFIVTACSAICFQVGLRYGSDIVKAWLSSLVVSVIVILVILEPLKVLLWTYVSIRWFSRVDVKDWLTAIPGPVIPRKRTNPPRGEERRLQNNEHSDSMHQQHVRFAETRV